MKKLHKSWKIVYSSVFAVATALLCGFPVEAALSSITVTPVDSTLHAGEIQPFTATGTFSGGSVRAVTGTPLAVRDQFSCSVLADGPVKCWGFAPDSGVRDPVVPVVIDGIENAVAVAAGSDHVCVLLADASIACWGNNEHGQLGNGNTATYYSPISVIGISNATAIAANNAHTCALLADRSVKCWGSNDSGQLGNGTTTDSSTPVQAQGVDNVAAVAAGSTHTCALLISGSIKCWGANAGGQLGDGTKKASNVPVSVREITTAVGIAAARQATCALLANGTMKCWGVNDVGQLGDGTTADASIPVAVSGINTARAMAVGERHACALLGDGIVKCWGSGPLGDGTGKASGVPVSVLGIQDATAIAGGDNKTCGVLTDGSAQCWRAGHSGNGLHYSSATPAAVAIDSVTAISTGARHDCFLLKGGAVKCWGDNQYGELGSPATTAGNSADAVTVQGISDATTISVGYQYACAVLADGTVQCWGQNKDGQLGFSGGQSDTPIAVVGVSTATAIAADPVGGHTCALLADGSIKCWGRNEYGELGDGTTQNSSAPVSVTGISNAIAVANGGNRTCALLKEGSVSCWGYNHTDPRGNTITDSIPAIVNGISNAVAITASAENTCALLADGSIKCWGGGSLGDGKSGSTSPVLVSGIGSAIAIANGGVHSCALLKDGSAQCWGDNQFGELGNPIAGSKYSGVPISVSGLTNATAISTTLWKSCALLVDQSVRCWGSFSGGRVLGPIQVAGLEQATLNAIQWRSDDATVAQVTGNGLTYGFGAGHATISAAVGSVSGSTTVFVDGVLAPTFVIGGAVVGLTDSLVLKESSGNVLTLTTNGAFAFATKLAAGASYFVAVATQPMGQICAVTNGAGTVGNADVTNVAVVCAPNTYTVSGTVTGLTGSVVLVDNGNDALTLSADGSFTFLNSIVSGAQYSVSVATQPSGQSCVVANGSGTVNGANITGVSVSCRAASAGGAPGSTGTDTGGGGGGGAIGPLLIGLLLLSRNIGRSTRC